MNNYILIIFLIILTNLEIKAQELKTKFQKKHELSFALHYAQQKYGDHVVDKLFIKDELHNDNILGSLTIGKKMGRGFGFRAQYNYHFHKNIYLSTSLNTFFYKPQYVKYNFTDINDFTTGLEPQSLETLLKFYTDINLKGKLAFSANQFFFDVGLGFIPYTYKRFNTRLGLGLIAGYHYYTDPAVYINYDEYNTPNNRSFIIFNGFRSHTSQSFMIGCFTEASLNYEIIPAKISIGANYKFTITNKWFKDGVFPQNFGVLVNIKM